MGKAEKRLERAAGIEPASSAWKAEVIAIIRCTQHRFDERQYATI